MTKIGPINLGGRTKVCLPIVAKTLEEVLDQCKSLATKTYDVTELRLDFLGDAYCKKTLLAATQAVREALPDRGLIVTWRNRGEGGEKDLDRDDYVDLLRSLIESGSADAIDLEYFFVPQVMKSLVDLAKARGLTVIMSNHDFHKTPSREEIVDRLLGMRKAGAQVAKLACMPQGPEDLLTLLAATYEVHKAYPDQALITMSMGHLGMLSRVCGSIFGNCLSFGTVGQASAPGQVPLDQLQSILKLLDQE